jgi:hypothetical protein
MSEGQEPLGERYCFSCGTKLPGEAAFCWRCGKPQAGGGRAQEAPVAPRRTRRETCEILIRKKVGKKGWGPFADDLSEFSAEATGSHGTYEAAKSDPFPVSGDIDWDINYLRPTDPETRRAHEDLVRRLTEAGWDRVPGAGDLWFNYHFVRTYEE